MDNAERLEAKRNRERVSVLILAKNEELLIGRAIRSAFWADEVLVVDSGSHDRTVPIAAELGARVLEQAWLGWAEQHRFAVKAATYDWVFSLDADEIITPELAGSISMAMAHSPDQRDGYVVEREDEFLGRLMLNMRRRAKKETFVRLFNRRQSNWNPEQIIHEEVVCPGTMIPLKGPLLHWRNYSIGRQIDTLNRNSDLEALMLKGSRFGGHPLAVAFKPVLRFGWIYLICGHWRLGMRGLIWAALHSGAEFMRQAKTWEAMHTQPTPHPPADIWRRPTPDSKVTAPASIPSSQNG